MSFVLTNIKRHWKPLAALFALAIVAAVNAMLSADFLTHGIACAMAAPVLVHHRRGRNLSRGTYSSFGEKLDYSYYDSFLMDHTVLSQNLFQQGLGGGTTPKRLDQTDMTIGAQLPRGQRFTIKNIKFLYTTHAALTTAGVQLLYTMLTKSTFEFFITGKDSLLTLTLQELLGANTLLAETPTVSGDNIPLISPRYHGIFPLNIPIILAEQTNFKVVVTHQVAPDVALDADIMKISLNGKLERKS